ncbi:M1 family metallopeptidase [Agriterribacter sp.]|uniref:M1 family metallopeptidase n=1 Tax=Agriterribacter sp. TaxID=2821509 RepID=UPI002BEE61ED|nr:M1 family metallopeptidase [Agriterribacter sp.]HRO47095.1 M1 family metallopeptidase [Agriterribacter sp.]HRQ17852.1 M1 family metallopeptidase [Agriterribacter sp.]
MKKFLLLIVINGFIAAGSAQQSYWQQQMDYSINVSLNDKEHTLDGFIKILYRNQSPDTLQYIWFHLWPNAFKNDQTAFSEQMLQNGDTRLYFSLPEQKGYINQLDFRVNDVRATITDHPLHLDIISVILPAPLLPGEQITITTPFHIQLPDRFSRSGHTGQSYQVTQWYPKPAVYDSKGWHPMPYLQQGPPYSEPGNFDVTITLPENYVVAATGELQNENEKAWLKTRASYTWKATRYRKKIKGGSYKTIRETFPPSAAATKTLHFKQNNVQDFAWFADKRFIVNYDTCALPSGKIIDVYTFYTPAAQKQWNNSIAHTKKALRFYSASVGTYPFTTLSIAEVPPAMEGGYPAITALSVPKKGELAERHIAHGAGQNWFYGILASNGREHPWMAAGMNIFYEKRYTAGEEKTNFAPFTTSAFEKIAFESVAAVKKDQPAGLPAPAFSPANYYLSAYYKAAQWMQLLESFLGKELFDSCMHVYYHQWQFKHPYPEDFRKVVSSVSGKNMDSIFHLLNTTGSLLAAAPKKTRLAWIGKAGDQKYRYIGIAPALGFNYYDKLMAGAVIHNYSLPFTRFRFITVPLYATGSKQFNGIGRATYTWYPENIFDNIEAGLSAARFSRDAFTDEDNHTTPMRYGKLSPQIRFTFRNKDPLSRLSRFVQLKTHFIHTDALQFSWDSVLQKSLYSVNAHSSTIGQLRFVTENSRALYPYGYTLQFELSKDFGRIAYTGNYFFNYPKGGGLNARWFAGKFFYKGDKTSRKRFDTDSYHLNMSAPKGYEDYTYSNYFMGRNEYNGFFSQQVMMRDGGFKVRTDLLSNKVGKTDDWLMALNFTSTIHHNIPVKLFLDMGTYNGGWASGSEQPKILFDAGLQLSLCKDILNVYVPLLYSKVYHDYFRSTPGNNFWQRIAFSIDIQNINFKKISPLIPF